MGDGTIRVTETDMDIVSGLETFLAVTQGRYGDRIDRRVYEPVAEINLVACLTQDDPAPLLRIMQPVFRRPVSYIDGVLYRRRPGATAEIFTHAQGQRGISSIEADHQLFA